MNQLVKIVSERQEIKNDPRDVAALLEIGFESNKVVCNLIRLLALELSFTHSSQAWQELLVKFKQSRCNHQN